MTNLPIVGIIANPVSARDIRRVIVNASNVQLADRVNIILRALAALGALGIRNVLMMPDSDGLGALVRRQVERECAYAGETAVWPTVTPLEMPVAGRAEDSQHAARLLRSAGAAAIIVLGGDGTHRAVVSECGDVPIAGISTGTNNAFPEMCEPTSVGIAVGLYATRRIPAAAALAANKYLEVAVDHRGDEGRHEIALVDVAILRDSFIGAGAMWDEAELTALYLSFAEPDAIGLSSVGGLLRPVSRRERGGLRVELACDDDGATAPRFWLRAPIAPGLLRRVGVHSWHRLKKDTPVRIRPRQGAIALDGERTIQFSFHDRVSITLRENAFRSIDVNACMRYAAAHGLLATPA